MSSDDSIDYIIIADRIRYLSERIEKISRKVNSKNIIDNTNRYLLEIQNILNSTKYLEMLVNESTIDYKIQNSFCDIKPKTRSCLIKECNDIYLECSKFNWDGDESDAITEEILIKTNLLFYILPDESIKYIDITPHPHGCFSIDWDDWIDRNNYVSIIISENDPIILGYKYEDMNNPSRLTYSFLNFIIYGIPKDFLSTIYQFNNIMEKKMKTETDS